MATHLALCGVAYPILLLLCALGNGRSLFVARLVVGAGTGVIGYSLAFNLHRFATRYLEVGGEWPISLACLSSQAVV